MKKLLLAILVSLSVGKISAQNEYLQNNPEWTVLRGDGFSFPCISYDSAHYYLNGDTVYNSNQYKVLWKCGHVWSSWQSPNPNMSCYFNYTYCDTIPTGLIRSQGKEMYFIYWNDTTEGLLHDFDLSIGDTVPQTMTYCCGGGDVITAIDSIYTPYGYRKTFYVNNNFQESIIEGVGSAYGLLEPYGPQLDQVYQLICYGLNDSAWYPSQGPYCDVMTVGPTTVQQEISLQLVPNPASEYVEVSASGFPVESITVYDVFGKVVKQQAGESKLFVGDLTPGIYMLRVSDGTSFSSSQLIVE